MSAGVIVLDAPKLETVAVSVKVLQIGKKQMTLSVFRQLAKADFFDSAGKGTGAVWGWVNYHWPAECDFAAFGHVHFVFERDGKLFRDHVATKSVSTGPGINDNKRDDLNRQWILTFPQLFIAI